MLPLVTLLLVGLLETGLSIKHLRGEWDPAIHGKCFAKGHADYEIKPCHAKFLTCFVGYGDIYECEDDLVFDGKTYSCQPLEICKKSREQDNGTILYFKGKPFEEEPEVEIDCTGKPDGLLPTKDCINTIFMCENEEIVVQRCRDDLVYDRKAQSCQSADKCGKVPVSSSPEKPRKQDIDAFFSFKESPEQELQTNYNCTGRDNGLLISENCMETYVLCKNGQPSVQKCPDALVYDKKIRRCEFADKCGKISSLPEATCREGELGNFPTGRCNNEYYHCAYRLPVYVKCPENLVFKFSWVDLWCDQKINVEGCAEYKTDEELEMDVDNVCARKLDGIYTFKCNSIRYHCRHQKPVWFDGKPDISNCSKLQPSPPRQEIYGIDFAFGF